MDIFKNLIIQDDYVVAGISAGPDSMALLDMLQKNLDKSIICAHINHNVRKESDEEENYLKEYCENNNIIFECLKIDSYEKSNFENEAREKRYTFYEEILKKYNSHTLFLAHHGDDLIETTIMKIIRGSNLEGYAGIKTISKQKNYTIIRPLLKYQKDDLIEYNKKNNITYFVDKTNEDITYTRNRIRKNILPQLKKEDQLVHLKFLKFSEELQDYYNYIEDSVKEKIKDIYIDNKIDISKLNQEHNFIKKNIIFYILCQIYDNKSNIIKHKHLLDILKMTNSQKQNYSVNLPKEYLARKEYNYIYIEKKPKDIKDYYIKLEKENTIGNIIIKIKDNIETNGNDVCKLNSKDIKLPLYLRNKKDGDYIEVLGLNGKKKVKDIFIDSKIPKPLRDNYPLLVDSDDNILWIPFIKKSKYNVKNNEFYDIILTSQIESEEKNEN